MDGPSFAPGENINIPHERISRTPTPGFAGNAETFPASTAQGIITRVPARIGISVKNMATFGPGKAGGGGIGMAINIFATTTVFVKQTPGHQETVINGSRESVLAHHVAVFRTALQHKGLSSEFMASVSSEDQWPAHCGLGSTSAMCLGLYFGLNYALGDPLEAEEIRMLLAHNYVEESKDDPKKLSFGYETTMTATGAMGGGMFVIDEHDLSIIARNTTAFESMKHAVLIFTPDPDSPDLVQGLSHGSPDSLKPNQAQVTVSDVNETEVLAEGAIEDAKKSEVEKKNSLFEKVLIPELQKPGLACDLLKVGAAVSQLQNSGGKRVEVMKQKTGKKIYAFLDRVSAEVPLALIAGMSSIGPSTFVFMKDPTLEQIEALTQIGRETGLKQVFHTSVNTTGLSITKVAFPETVLVLGPPAAGKTTLCQELASQQSRHSGPSSSKADDPIPTSPTIFLHFSAGQVLREALQVATTLNSSHSCPPPMQKNLQPEEIETIKETIAKGESRDSTGGVFIRFLTRELHQQVAKSFTENLGPSVLQYVGNTDGLSLCLGESFKTTKMKRVVLLDGFPRSCEQLSELQTRFGITPSSAIFVNAPYDVRENRSKERATKDPSRMVDPSLDARSKQDLSIAILEKVRDHLQLPVLSLVNATCADHHETSESESDVEHLAREVAVFLQL